MGKIRGLHTSPGIYTKITSIRNRGVVSKAAPNNTTNETAAGGYTSDSSYFYFGYMPITTENGKITEEGMAEIMSKTGDEIKNLPTIAEIRTSRPYFEPTGGADLIIPSEINESELVELLNNGNEYETIADEHNKCVVIMIPSVKYANPEFNILDERFNTTASDIFPLIKHVEVNGVDYVLLCMFNDLFSYSAIGDEKVIAPLKLIFWK